MLEIGIGIVTMQVHRHLLGAIQQRHGLAEILALGAIHRDTVFAHAAYRPGALLLGIALNAGNAHRLPAVVRIDAVPASTGGQYTGALASDK